MDPSELERLIAEADPPSGFQPSRTRGPFTSHNGPYFHKVEGDQFWHGFRALERHGNSHGILHGGMLMAFGDGLLATAVVRETKARAVTVRMNSDFVDMARPGDWIEGTARVTRAARTIAFVEAEVHVQDRLIFTASGVFKLFRREGRK
jgi:uncharacterized protein (TIGR00369 family)